MSTNKWMYGNKNEIYNIEPGDVFTVGEHIFACGDVNKGDGIRLLDKLGITPAMTYTDPPWGLSNYGAFHTKAGLAKQATYDVFLDNLLKLLMRTEGDVYCEMGVKQLQYFSDKIRSTGAAILNTFDTTYYDKHPAKLIIFRWFKLTKAVASVDMNGMDDDDTPKIAIEQSSRPGEYVFDPCAGRGLTPITAIKLKRRSVSMELNKNRIADAIYKAQVETGYSASKVTEHNIQET